MSNASTFIGQDRSITATAARNGRRIWSAVRSYPGHADTPSERAIGCMTGVTNLRRR